MIYTFRHCHRWDRFDREWSKKVDYWYDPPLSQHGMRQAIGFREKLKDVKRIYVSPFLRCIQTAYLATEGVELCIEYSLMEALKDSTVGDEDVVVQDPRDLVKHYPTINLEYKSFLNMNCHIGSYRESRKHVRRRVTNFVNHIIRDNKEDNIGFCGHAVSVKDCNVRFGLSGNFPSMGQLDSVSIDRFK